MPPKPHYKAKQSSNSSYAIIGAGTLPYYLPQAVLQDFSMLDRARKKLSGKADLAISITITR